MFDNSRTTCMYFSFKRLRSKYWKECHEITREIKLIVILISSRTLNVCGFTFHVESRVPLPLPNSLSCLSQSYPGRICTQRTKHLYAYMMKSNGNGDQKETQGTDYRANKHFMVKRYIPSVGVRDTSWLILSSIYGAWSTFVEIHTSRRNKTNYGANFQITPYHFFILIYKYVYCMKSKKWLRNMRILKSISKLNMIKTLQG